MFYNLEAWSDCTDVQVVLNIWLMHISVASNFYSQILYLSRKGLLLQKKKELKIHSSEGPYEWKDITHHIYGYHITGTTHPSPFLVLAFPKLWIIPTNSWVDWGTFKLSDLPRVTQEPFICMFYHPMCEEHDGTDLKASCLLRSMKQFFLHSNI